MWPPLVITIVWFTLGGTWDLRRLFQRLKTKEKNLLDDGRVVGHISANDVEMVEKIDHIQIPEAHREEEILVETLEENADKENITNTDEQTRK